ncbi:MAG: FAD-binding oxidoreductase [Candidatus Micrarchaeia archaeon]|jgi:ferredoxin-NADP reductase
MVDRIPYKVSKSVAETHDVRSLVLVPVQGEVPQFKPGQFVNLAIKTAEGNPPTFAFKPYSLSSSPTERDHLSLTVKLVERENSFSQLVGSLKPGDVVYLNGPFGMFTFDEAKHSDVVMIAGGVGITPFRSMIKYCTDKKLQNKLLLLFSNKTCKDTPFHADFMAFEKQNPNFRSVCTVTREEGKVPDGFHTGRFDEERIKQLAGGQLSSKYFMICGSTPFVQGFRDLLASMGVPKERILYELFGNSV